MYRRENGAMFRYSAYARCPSEAFKGFIVEVGFPSVTFPSADRKQNLHPRAIYHLRELFIFFPCHAPAVFGCSYG